MIANFGLSCYKGIIATKFEDVVEIGRSILFPKFQKSYLSSLIQAVKEFLKAETPVAHIAGDVIVVGDIHGHFHDLIRIFAKT